MVIYFTAALAFALRAGLEGSCTAKVRPLTDSAVFRGWFLSLVGQGTGEGMGRLFERGHGVS